MCRPVWPYCRNPDARRKGAPFFGLNDHLGIVTALILGFQVSSGDSRPVVETGLRPDRDID
jgi:hypothetical protein